MARYQCGFLSPDVLLSVVSLLLFCCYYFYFNEGFIICSGKTKTSVGRLPFCHQAAQCSVGDYLPADAPEGR